MSDEKIIHCEKCGGDYTFGAFPFCKGNPRDHGSWDTAEQPCAPFDSENLTDGPGTVTFTSVREKVKYMDKHNLVPHKPRDSWKPGRLFLDLGKH